MTGLMPDNESLVFALNFIFMMIFMYCYLVRAITSYSIISDITDEHELDHGVRQEAGFFARIWDSILLFFVGILGGDPLEYKP